MSRWGENLGVPGYATSRRLSAPDLSRAVRLAVPGARGTQDVAARWALKHRL
jgi:hypothetical protein